MSVRGLAIALLLAAPLGATTSHAPPAPPLRPAPPLPSLPSVARVHIDVSREHMVVVEEVDLPRGDWRSGDLDLFVAFGAPGAPEAIDAHLLSVPDGALEPFASDAGEAIAVERAPRRPLSAQPLLGPPQMAGVVLHVADAAFRRAVAPGRMAALRLRSLLPLSDEDPRGGREVLVRLGSARDTPLTVGRVQIASIEKSVAISRAEARLCGPDADPWPLAIMRVPGPAIAAPPSASAPRATPAPIAPVLAVRHATDDLCVRFWTATP